jgi:squalene synthase HpnC
VIHRAFGSSALPQFDQPAPPETLELDACYGYCEAMAGARHHNFPVASLFVPSHLRKHIWAVYAFARTADDYADEPEFEGRRSIELDRWEEKLEACFHGEPPDHPVFVALGDTIRRFDLPITPFVSLLAGYRTDLETRRIASYQELRSYTALAAEPVGQLFLYLSGFRDPGLLRYVDALGGALAEAKFWQDIHQDLIRDRVYVPTEDLMHFGVTIEALKADKPEKGFGNLVRFLVARTRAQFERARPLVDQVGDDIAVEMAISWHGGMRILDKIEHVGADLLFRRPQLNSADKALVVSRALAWRGSSLTKRVWL